MKKILTLCAGILLVFGLAACDENTDLPGPGEEPEPEVTEPEPETGGEGGDTGDGGETQYVELELIKDEYTLAEDDDPVKLEYNVNPLESDVNVTSSNVNTATVEKDEYGQWWITPVLAGYGDATLTVTASYEGYESDIRTATVTVQEAEIPSVVTGIEFSEQEYTIGQSESITFVVGQDIIISGTGNYSTDFEISVDPEYETYVTISEDKHTVTASAYTDSEITLYATATGGDVAEGVQPATAKLTITQQVVEPVVESIVFNEDSYVVDYGGTLDLSNAVTVTGNEALTNTGFTITSEDTTHISITDNVVTGLVPTTEAITITATASADESKTATATITVKDTTNYVSRVYINNVPDEGFTIYTGATDEETPTSVSVTASVVGVDETNEPYESGYEIKTDSSDISIEYDGTTESWVISAASPSAKESKTAQIYAVSTGLNGYEGQTVKSESVTVNIEYVPTLVSGVTFSKTSMSLTPSTSFKIGPSGVNGADVEVSITPADADDPSYTLTVATEDTSKLSIGQADENGLQTVTTSLSLEHDAVETAKIIATANTPGSEYAYAELNVTITSDDHDIVYVTEIGVTPSTLAIEEGESITIGDSSTTAPDVVVTLNPNGETPTDGNYSITLTTDTQLVTISTGADEYGHWTIEALTGAGGETEGGQEYTFTIASHDGHATNTFTLTVNRPTPVASSMKVTTAEGSEDLSFDMAIPAAASGETAETLDLSTALTVTIYDQYEDEYSDQEWTATLSEGVGVVSISNKVVTPLTVGEAKITIAAEADSTLTSEVSISVTDKIYYVESISIGESEVEVAWGGTHDIEVTYNPTWATYKGYTVTHLSGTEELFSFEDGTFTHNAAATGDETFTIAATDTTNDASCTIKLTVNKVDIEPTGITLDSSVGGDYEKGTDITISASDYELTYDTSLPDEAVNKLTGTITATSSNNDAVTVDTDGTTLHCVAAGSSDITLTVTTSTGDEYTSESVTINVTVAATGFSIDPSSLSLTEGDESVQLSLVWTPDDATDTVDVEDVAWSTDNDGVATVEKGVVTAVGAGSTTIRATYGSFEATCSVEVASADTTFTFRMKLLGKTTQTVMTLPETYDYYLTGYFNDWALDETLTLSACTVAGYEDYYDAVLQTPPSDTSDNDDVQILVDKKGDQEDWNHDLAKFYPTISNAQGGGSWVGEVTCEVDDVEDLFYEGSGEEVNFYFVAEDQTNSVNQLSESVTLHAQSYAFWNGSSSTTMTETKNGNGYVAIYNTQYGTGTDGDSDYFYISATNLTDVWTANIQTLKATEAGTYCVIVQITNFWQFENKGGWTMWDGETYTNVTDIAEFVAALTVTGE